MPNWREGLICRACHLNSRMMASIHLLLWALANEANSGIYITEQVTALYRWVKLRFPNAVGSEYLRDGTARGGYSKSGIRHEDLTDLSFADESFGVVISLEVLEHIPDFRKAISECARVLKPGGKLLLSVPFHAGPRHTLRARMSDDGTIEHLRPPEYHGDPLDRQGCLCFHHFGWDILDFLRQAGFRQASAYSIWSRELGYLAAEGDILQFIAVR
jgi:SAM-dependent methyltransferase